MNFISNYFGAFKLKKRFEIVQSASSNQLFCDIDSTINNHAERIIKWRRGSQKPFMIHKQAFSEKEVLKDEVRFNSDLWIRKFKDNNWQINWISARPRHLYKATLAWLFKKDFPVDSLTLVPRAYDKLKYINKYRVDLFVDDLSYGQENEELFLYDDIIHELENSHIKFEIFKDNWEFIFKKYNQV